MLHKKKQESPCQIQDFHVKKDSYYSQDGERLKKAKSNLRIREEYAFSAEEFYENNCVSSSKVFKF